jgi:recombination protein RecT
MNNQLSVPQQIFSPAMQKEMVKVLPKNLSPERMARIALTEYRKNKKLQECAPASFMGALMKCSELGLEPASSLGHAYLVPYGTECQLIVGYRGFMHLARKSGKIKNMYARVVREGDFFNYEYGLHEDLTHRPKADSKAKMTHVYAVAVLTDGTTQFDVMSAEEVNKIKARSKSGKSGPWVSDYEEMAKKTVIRRLCKYLPLSYELEAATGLDELGDVGKQQFTYDAEPVEQQPEATPEEEILKHIEATN